MDHPLFQRLAQRPLVADGGMGTMLQEAGLTSEQVGEAWNIDQPEKIRFIHGAYLEAGSDIVLTNTFGGSRLRLTEQGLGEKTEQINRAAARLAREVADSFDALVLGDIGPSGQLMEPFGTVSEEEMAESFRVQARALVAGGVHGLIVETMTSNGEMLAALRAAREAAGADIPVIASYSFKKAGGHYRTMMGESVTQCAMDAVEAGANIVGTNCGMGIEEMIEVVREIWKTVNVPIIAQPNAGLPEVVRGKIVYRQTAEMMVAKVPELIEAGARIVGGCCGTNPHYIRLLKQKVLNS